MIDAKTAREFVTDTDGSFHTKVMAAIITAMHDGRLHAEVDNVDFTKAEIEWMQELGYTVHKTIYSITLYWDK